jgi:hypothetical protein
MEENLNMERLIEPIAIKVLINGVYNYFLWKRLYALSNWNLLDIKHTMKNYIRVEEASIIRQRTPSFLLTSRVFTMPSASHKSIYKKHQGPYPRSPTILIAYGYTYDHHMDKGVSCYQRKWICAISTFHEKWHEHKEP